MKYILTLVSTIELASNFKLQNQIIEQNSPARILSRKMLARVPKHGHFRRKFHRLYVHSSTRHTSVVNNWVSFSSPIQLLVATQEVVQFFLQMDGLLLQTLVIQACFLLAFQVLQLDICQHKFSTWQFCFLVQLKSDWKQI